MGPKNPTNALLHDWAKHDRYVREIMVDRYIENQIDFDLEEKRGLFDE